MSLEVVNPGLFATVQDLGRLGFRAFGVPLGGAFDRGAAALANALLGNDPASALIELTLAGGTFEARGPLALALAGAPFEARLINDGGDGSILTIPVAFPICPGDRLQLGRTRRGARGYLAVLGGWETPVVLGSRSSETALRPGDVLTGEAGWTPIRHPDPEDDPFATAADAPLRVVDGPDAGRVDPGWLGPGVVYEVGSQSNRMGLRLKGRELEVAADPERVSTPVAPGAVQVAGGALLVLGVACGTMGGYPHVAHVISADLDRLGQARPGDRVTFARVSLAEARRLDREARIRQSRRLERIATAARDGLVRGRGGRDGG